MCMYKYIPAYIHIYDIYVYVKFLITDKLRINYD